MSARTPREILAEADCHNRTAEAAEWARTKIRLGEEPVQRGGLLRFLRREDAHREMVFTAVETRAIYLALGIVRNNEREAAASLEQQVAATQGGAA